MYARWNNFTIKKNEMKYKIKVKHEIMNVLVELN